MIKYKNSPTIYNILFVNFYLLSSFRSLKAAASTAWVIMAKLFVFTLHRIHNFINCLKTREQEHRLFQ